VQPQAVFFRLYYSPANIGKSTIPHGCPKSHGRQNHSIRFLTRYIAQITQSTSLSLMSPGEFHKLHLSRTCSSQNPHSKEVAALPGRASPKLKFRGCPTNNKPFTSTGRWSVTRGGLRTLTLTAAFPCEGPSHVSAPPVRHERPQDLRTLRYSCLPIVLGVLTSSTLDTEIPFSLP
jgi:hypothetical protein